MEWRLSALAVGVFALAAGGARSAPGPPLGEPAGPPRVDLIYVDANEGGASGGHSALRVGDAVYHFRALSRTAAMPGGERREWRALRLHRQSWRSFRVHYSSLENRNLRGAELALAAADATRVETHFAKLFAVQTQRRDVLRWLELEASLAAASGGLASAPIPGAALFEWAQPPDPHARRVRGVVESARGEGFLRDALLRAEEAVARLPRATGVLPRVALRRDSSPLAAERPLAGERLEHAAAWRAALRALAEARPLSPVWLRSPLAGEGRRLSQRERARVEELRGRLDASLLRLLDSRRPDRGEALLVTIARLQALDRSLAAGILRTLDPVDGAEALEHPEIDPEAGERRRAALRSWHRAMRRAHQARREEWAAGPRWDEASLHVIEVIAARDAALASGIRGRVPFRLGAAPSLPLPAASRPLPPLRAADPAVGRENLARYLDALEELERYRLVRRNCATELLRELRAAFGGDAEANRALGGALHPGGRASFIPFALDRAALRELRIRRQWELPSHRRRRLAEMRRNEGALTVALREGNTLSSTLYERGPEESHFLFFTDERPWARPLLGAFNLGFGLVQSGAGLVTAPFDRARRLREGLRGAFYAFPELAFFNVRKGRYEWVEELDGLAGGD